MSLFDSFKTFLKNIHLFRATALGLRKVIWEIEDRLAGLHWLPPDIDVVLIVRVDNIGDFILWLESAGRIKSYFAPKRIILVANQAFSELAEQCGYFDQVIPIDILRLGSDRLYRFRTLGQVRRLRSAIAIQPTYSRVFSTGDALIRASGAPQRFGSVGDLSNSSASERGISDRWYTRLIPADGRPMMEIERHCELLRGLGVGEFAPAVSRLGPVAQPPSWFRTDTSYFVVFPGASSTMRMWPADLYGATARAIQETYGWRLVVCGSAAESDLARKVIVHAEAKDALDLCGKTTLPELAEVIRGARLLIGNETSAAHVAAAVGTPSVCLLGGGHFRRFMPYPPSVAGPKPIAVYHEMPCFNCNWRCEFKHSPSDPAPCIAAIKTDNVIKAVHQAIMEDGSNH